MFRVEQLQDYIEQRKKEWETDKELGKPLDYNDVFVFMDNVVKVLDTIDSEHEQVRKSLKKLLEMIDQKSK